MEKLEIKAEVSIDDAGTITGVAWPFGSADSVGDVIEKGAFALPPALPIVMEHDQSQVVGVWESAAETDAGLEVKGRLFVEGIGPARKARDLLQRKSITGLSIGFHADDFERLPTGGRKFNGLTVTEISLCRRPVHPDARITSVKSMEQESPQMENEDLNNDATLADGEFIKAANDNFAALTARLDKLEAKAKRPVAANDNDGQPTEARKAFDSFLRYGEERMDVDERKALTVANDTNGGYLAPEEFGSELIKLLIEYSPIRQYARVINISAPELKLPRRLTGTAAVWVAETADRTASAPTFEQLTFAPHELATFTDISRQLLEDNAYNLEGELMADFAESFGKTEGTAFVKGTGTGQPKGIMVATGIAEVKTGVAADFPSSNPADVIIGMYHALATTHAQNGVWVMNRNTLATVRKWKNSAGDYLVLDPITASGAKTLLGRPIVEAIDMDDIGANKFPILFGDMSGYRIVDRLGLSTLRDPFSLAAKGQVRIHAYKRVGADVTHPDRFVKLKVAA